MNGDYTAEGGHGAIPTEGVETGSDCRPTKGTWTSPYDDGKWTEPGDVDIDHMVPLAQAWRSLGSEVTVVQRGRRLL